MPYNGSGTFTPYTPGNPAVPGTVISSTAYNSTQSDIAAGLSNAVTRDGQSPPSANLPMGGKKLTGLAAGAIAGDSLRWEQLFSQGTEQDIASAATTDIGALNTTVARITGTTTITSLGANYNGPRYVRFAGILTLTHNATTLVLPGGVNITTAAGDGAVVVPIGNPASGWKVLVYQSAQPLGVAYGGTGSTTVGGALNTLLGNGPLAGFRNLIINGNFAVNQRAYVSGAATGGANQYTLDRWRVVTSGQNITYSTSGNGRIVTAPAGGMEQVIDGANIPGGTYVISWTGTATCTVDGVAKTSGATFALTASTNATVRFTGGTVSLVQVEPGSTVTAFEPRHYSMELDLCAWYFKFWEAGYSDTVVSASTRYAFAQFSEMRATPTIVNVAAIGTQAGVSSVAFNDVTARGLRMDITPTGAGTVLCRRSISLSAEL